MAKTVNNSRSRTGRTSPSHAPRPRSSAPKRRKGAGKKPRVVKLDLWSVLAIVLLLAAMVGHRLFSAGVKLDASGAKLPAAVHGDYGIDISHNNRGTIVWDSLMVMTDKAGRTIHDIEKAKSITPVSFVFIKATEGQSMTDRRFKEHWKAAADHGVQRGAYHFYRTSKDPLKQAQSYIRTVGNLRHGDLPPVLDIETMHKGFSKEQLNKNIRIWLDHVEKHYGRKPMIYTYESFAKDYLSKEILENYPIWIAHYKTEKPDRADWQFWQFTDRALVYGIQDPVDLSVRRK